MKDLIKQFIDKIINQDHEQASAIFHQYTTETTKQLIETKFTDYGYGDYETNPQAWQDAGIAPRVGPKRRSNVRRSGEDDIESPSERSVKSKAVTQYKNERGTVGELSYNHAYVIHATDAEQARRFTNHFDHVKGRDVGVADVRVGRSGDDAYPYEVKIYYWENVPGDKWPDNKPVPKYRSISDFISSIK